MKKYLFFPLAFLPLLAGMIVENSVSNGVYGPWYAVDFALFIVWAAAAYFLAKYEPSAVKGFFILHVPMLAAWGVCFAQFHLKQIGLFSDGVLIWAQRFFMPLVGLSDIFADIFFFFSDNFSFTYDAAFILMIAAYITGHSLCLKRGILKRRLFNWLGDRI